MKYDQQKPQARRFYWDGLAKLVNPQEAAIIQSYQAFEANPILPMLKKVFEACRVLNEPLMADQVLRIYQYGSEKYGDKNYLGLDLGRIIEADGRHLAATCLGQKSDQESGYLHIGHFMANVLIAAELIKY